MTPHEALEAIIRGRASGKSAKEIAFSLPLSIAQVHQVCSAFGLRKLKKMDVDMKPAQALQSAGGARPEES